MFREVRRNKRQVLSRERATALLESSTSGVLALLGDDDYAYGVPMSYRYKDDKLYFHCAMQGHKIDAINKHDKVSFTVIETDRIAPEKFTTCYRSVIVFGKIHIVDDIEQKREALDLIVEKYSPEYISESKNEIEGSLQAVQALVLDIEHISGKEAKEFATSNA